MDLKDITLDAESQPQKDSCCTLLNYETLVRQRNNQDGGQSSGSQASGMRGGGGCGSERLRASLVMDGEHLGHGAGSALPTRHLTETHVHARTHRTHI